MAMDKDNRQSGGAAKKEARRGAANSPDMVKRGTDLASTVNDATILPSAFDDGAQNATIPPRVEDAMQIAAVLPRVLVVSRRTVRKNKFVDFVGEYHLDLIVSYGAVPVIVPRVSGLHSLLDSFEPIHGVLLCEGEDIDPSLYESDIAHLTPEQVRKIKADHSSDTAIDKDKDSIELQLARRCLERNIPYLGICRGSQVLNIACGGSLYQDVETELASKNGIDVQHISYENYDGHRHPVTVLEETPLSEWFEASLKKNAELNVNSYHHQGIKRLAERFKPMAFAPDGLVEGFYDPDTYSPAEGKFIVGLQFHPERMRHEQDVPSDSASSNGAAKVPETHESQFDYPGCPRAYQEFVRAVVAYHKRLLVSGKERIPIRLDMATMETQRSKLLRSFSLAKHIYDEEHLQNKTVHGEGTALKVLDTNTAMHQNLHVLKIGAKLLKSNTALKPKQVKFLNQMGATVRNSSQFLQQLHLNMSRETEARKLISMANMEEEELQELIDFYQMMTDAATAVLKQKLQQK